MESDCIFLYFSPFVFSLGIKTVLILENEFGISFLFNKAACRTPVLALLSRADTIQWSIQPWAFLFHRIHYHWLNLIIFMDLLKLLVAS